MSGAYYRANLPPMSTLEMLTRSLAVTPKPVDKIQLCGSLRDVMTACGHMVLALEKGTPIEAQDWNDLDLSLFDAARDVASFRGRLS